MNKLTKRLHYKGPDIERRNMLWNMAGSFSYALASMVLTFLVMRMAGENQGGIFAYGFSTLGQQMFIIAYFGLRPFQITDGKGEFSFRDYLDQRRLTCLLALAAGGMFLIYKVAAGDYSVFKAMVLILLVLYKVADGYADVYESEFQRRGSLYLTGKSNLFRTLLTVSAFLLTLRLTGDLLAACAVAVAAQAAGVCLFNLDVIHALDGVSWVRGKGQISRLFGSTLLLFASAFLDFYVFSSAKYAIDARLSDAHSGYFNMIFMPTSVIYMVANFVIRPFLTRLTVLWEEKRYPGFKEQVVKLGTIILGLTVLAVSATLLLGRWVLGLMEMILGPGYEGRLTRYQTAFVLIVLGGGFYALANLMYYALVIMRKQKEIFAVYLAAALAALFLAGPMVGRWGIGGAAGCYLMLMSGLVAGFGACTVSTYRNAKGENCGNAG